MHKSVSPKLTIPSDLLTRGVTDVVPRELSQTKLASSKKLRVYLGIDPTGVKLHLGHAIPLRKLKAFQEAGHHVILVIGSFTAMIGDPSGRGATREPLTEAQVKKNFATYKKQAALVLDFKKVELRYNHEWLGKLNSKQMLELTSKFTVQQLMERDMFQERQRKAQPVGVHELLYPLMVGYDSVVLDVDVELGGNDQLFNMLCGRTLQQAYGKRDKFVLTTKLLEGTDGRKMSKTYNNCIYLTDTAQEMFGKLLSINDSLITIYMECCTNIPMEEIDRAEVAIIGGANPMEFKRHLAREVVTLYHGIKAAEKAEVEFGRVHKEGKLPDEMPEYAVPKGKKEMSLLEFLVYLKLATSKAEARRLVTQGGVKVGGQVVKDWQTIIPLSAGLVVQVGSRKFAKLS